MNLGLAINVPNSAKPVESIGRIVSPRSHKNFVYDNNGTVIVHKKWST